jgi:hypothetical protein
MDPGHKPDAGRTTRRVRRQAPILRALKPPAERAGLAVVLMLLAAACSATGHSPAPTVTSTSSSQSSAPLTVTSTLDGHTALPHRIHWEAMPSVPSADVSEVDFLIDGKSLWAEYHAPYFYGDDGNYLVTSFLKPGVHQFTVKVVAVDGKTASDRVTATVPSAPAPPAALTGAWKSFQKGSAAPGSPPTGYWRLVINKIGWQVYDTAGTGDLLDVAYLSPGLLEVRTGMASGHPQFDLNGWCNNEPGSSVRYHWSVTGQGLTMHLAGGRPCPGFNDFMASAWTRVR